MDMKQLKYFHTIAQEKSFTKAASILYISQPALSKAMKQLEDELGVKLLSKCNNKLSLTDIGNEFFLNVENAILSFDNITKSIYDVKDLQCGHLVVGIPPIIGVLYFVSIITSFKTKYKGVTLSIVEEGADVVISKVRSEELDIGIGIQPTAYPDLEGISVFSDEVVALVHKSNPLSVLDCVNFEQLKKENFHLLNKDFSLYSQVISKCKKAGFIPSIESTSSQWDFIMKMVERSGGTAILPQPIVSALPPALKILKFKPKFKWEIMIWKKKNRYTSYASRAFINEIENYFSNLKSVKTL